MNPGLRLSATLTLSLVLWSPTMLACLRGDLDLATAGLRYLLAFGAARVAMGLLSAVISSYTRDDEGEPASGDDEAPKRRRDDPSTAEAGSAEGPQDGATADADPRQAERPS